MELDLIVDSARRRADELKAKADDRRRVGWEISDVMTPGELETLAIEVRGLADLLAKWKSIADTRLESAQINHAAYEKLAAELK